MSIVPADRTIDPNEPVSDAVDFDALLKDFMELLEITYEITGSRMPPGVSPLVLFVDFSTPNTFLQEDGDDEKLRDIYGDALKDRHLTRLTLHEKKLLLAAVTDDKKLVVALPLEDMPKYLNTRHEYFAKLMLEGL